jgi:hypothetical protein
MAAAAPAGRPVPAILNDVDFDRINTTYRPYKEASDGSNKKVWGGIAITIGGLAIVGAVAAIALPMLLNGAPNVLNMGQQLGNAGGMGSSAMSFSATIGTLAVAGTIVVGGIVVAVGSVLVHKGRKEAEEKKTLQRRFEVDLALYIREVQGAAREEIDAAYNQGDFDGYERRWEQTKKYHEGNGVRYTLDPSQPEKRIWNVDYSNVMPARRERDLALRNVAILQREVEAGGAAVTFDPRTGAAIVNPSRLPPAGAPAAGQPPV